jgi:photosystem II stability/assembly factor-like uncharacterized protein
VKPIGFVRHALAAIVAAGAIAVVVYGQGAAQRPRLDRAMLDAIPLRLIGPSAPSGRVWDVVGVPSQPKTFYACTAEGGVWKTTNHGITIQPIFDEENAAVCGTVAVAPSDPNVVWVGSGEPAARQSNGLGYGVYKSLDGGTKWEFLGLEKTEQIGAIAIDPRNPQTVFVAAMGHLWGRNQERGIFKTSDGGRTWRRVLYVDDMTGAIDVAIDPRDPAVLYATTWQRLRSAGAEMRESGPGSGIYKSTDGGERWTRLTSGIPNEPLSKITLAVAKKMPGLVYAYILSGEPRRGGRTSDVGGIFRSEDAGATWRRVSPKLASRTYYTHIKVDPSNDQRLFILDLELWRSDDGGSNWAKHNMKNVHFDLHGLWIDPTDPDHLVLAGDAGVNVSFDNGASWFQTIMPLGQFYEIDVDMQEPYRVYGGMQDTASWSGPSRTYDNDGITDHDWVKLRSVGDGMAIHPHPRDPAIVYMAQNNGNLSRLDMRTWTRTELQPDPAMAARLGLHEFRWDWSPPFIVSSQDPNVLYVGGNYVFRCQIGGALPNGEVEHTCSVISPDLSARQDQPVPPVGEGHHSYGALFSLAQSPVDAAVLWAGADDGPIHVSRDGGQRWTRVDGSLPAGSYKNGFVSKIEPSRKNAGTAYVAYDLHYNDDPKPYLFKTTDFGATWTTITNDLPAWGSTYVIREDPHNERVLYVGTESGLFVSIDGGGHWVRWKATLPHTAVRSLVVHPRDKELVVGTFGRSIWIGDVSVVEQLETAMSQSTFLFEVKPAIAHNIRFKYGTAVEEINGDLFFRAPNPPYGATISYWLRNATGGDAKVTIADGGGKVIRTLTGAGSAGIQHVQWDLETDAAKAQVAPGFGPGRDRSAVTLSERQRRRRVVPGTYTATLEVGSTKLTRPIVVRAEAGLRAESGSSAARP